MGASRSISRRWQLHVNLPSACKLWPCFHGKPVCCSLGVGAGSIQVGQGTHATTLEIGSEGVAEAG